MRDGIALLALSVLVAILVSVWRATTTFSARIDRRARRRQQFGHDVEQERKR